MKKTILALVLGMASISNGATPGSGTILDVKVTAKGFEPAQLTSKPGEPVTLKITRTVKDTCSTAVQIPSLKIKKALPLNKPVLIALGKLDKGDIKFGCSMDMMESATIHVQ